MALTSGRVSELVAAFRATLVATRADFLRASSPPPASSHRPEPFALVRVACEVFVDTAPRPLAQVAVPYVGSTDASPDERDR